MESFTRPNYFKMLKNGMYISGHVEESQPKIPTIRNFQVTLGK